MHRIPHISHRPVLAVHLLKEVPRMSRFTTVCTAIMRIRYCVHRFHVLVQPCDSVNSFIAVFQRTVSVSLSIPGTIPISTVSGCYVAGQFRPLFCSAGARPQQINMHINNFSLPRTLIDIVFHDFYTKIILDVRCLQKTLPEGCPKQKQERRGEWTVLSAAVILGNRET